MNYKLRSVLQIYRETPKDVLFPTLRKADPLWHSNKMYYREAASIAKNYMKILVAAWSLFIIWSVLGLFFGLTWVYGACLMTYAVIFFISWAKKTKYNALSLNLWKEELYFFSTKHCRV